jgi:hypothetical protein
MMLSLPVEIIAVLQPFAPAFRTCVWEWAKVLLVGAILAPGWSDRDVGVAGGGIEPGAAFRELSSGPESRLLVEPGTYGEVARRRADIEALIKRVPGFVAYNMFRPSETTMTTKPRQMILYTFGHFRRHKIAYARDSTC